MLGVQTNLGLFTLDGGLVGCVMNVWLKLTIAVTVTVTSTYDGHTHTQSLSVYVCVVV